MGTVTKVIGSAKGFYDVARYLKKDRESGADRDTGFRMGYNVSPEAMEAAREMAEAAEGRLMHEPCLHLVLSPEPAQGGRLGSAELEQMVGDLRREMGWQDYQMLAVEHLDTDHQHVHLMINRAHPLHTGESIDGYYLYKDLRRWAQEFDARQQRVERENGLDAQGAPSGVEGVERYEAGLVLEDSASGLASEGYVAEPFPEAGTPPEAHAIGDRPPSPHESKSRPDYAAMEGPGNDGTGQVQGSEPAAGQGPPRLTDLSTLSEQAGLSREVATIVELERLAHEKEMALAMLRADTVYQKTMGQALLSDEGRRLLRETAEEIDVILERQQGSTEEAVEHRLRPDPIHRGDGMPTPEPSLEAPPRDLHERIKESYQKLLREAQPYWMHGEGAVRDMKDLAMLRGPEAVTRAIRHEPGSVGERTTIPMSEADAERVAEAYRRYETYRHQYVAEVMERMDLQGERVPTRSGVSERLRDARSEGPTQSADPVARAEQLFYRDVTSRLLEERIEEVQTDLGKAKAHAMRLREAVRERAYHHLHTALRETYNDPAEAFRRLEAYYRQGQTDYALRKPELLGEMKRTRVQERVRGETPRKRAADIIRRYDQYVDGPEVRGSLDVARGRIEDLQAQRKVLTAMQQRVGTPEAIQRKYGEVRKALTARARRRLGIRLKHLPGSAVRRRSGDILKRALREYPGKVRPGQIKGLASQKAVNRAMRKAARGVGAKMAVKQPLQFAMRAGGVATRVASAVYRSAQVFFER